MRNLQDATERICELKGSLLALDALLTAVIHVMPRETREELRETFEQHAEVARTVLLHTPISEHTIGTFERDVRRATALVSRD